MDWPVFYKATTASDWGSSAVCKAIESIRMLVNVLAIGFYCTLVVDGWAVTFGTS